MYRQGGQYSSGNVLFAAPCRHCNAWSITNTIAGCKSVRSLVFVVSAQLALKLLIWVVGTRVQSTDECRDTRSILHNLVRRQRASERGHGRVPLLHTQAALLLWLMWNFKKTAH